jgi:uncharacterized protein YprB with RNaseH-like and TPR domain
VTAQNVEALMSGVHVVVTFNGDGFDLPVIKKHLNVDLLASHHSLDLYKVKKDWVSEAVSRTSKRCSV